MRSGKMKDLRRAAKEQGWEVKTTGGGHIKFLPPKGEMVIAPSTPSDRRGWLNTRAQLRKAGLRI